MPALGAVLCFVYFCSWGVLAFYGQTFWRTHCESFGCTGLGIAWVAWSGLYVIALILGVMTVRTSHRRLQRLVRSLLVIQLAAGAGLLGYWAVHAAA